jgi:hypothetical protein
MSSVMLKYEAMKLDGNSAPAGSMAVDAAGFLATRQQINANAHATIKTEKSYKGMPHWPLGPSPS